MSNQERKDQPRANIDGKVSRHVFKGKVPVGTPAGKPASEKRRAPEGGR